MKKLICFVLVLVAGRVVFPEEADSFSPYGKYFYRFCSETEKHRLSEMASRPHRLRPRGVGEKRAHRPSYIDGEVLPGDSVTWSNKEGDLLSGEVCKKGEGLYVEELKSWVKVTKTQYRARPEDWLPTAATSNYHARAKSVSDLMARFNDEVLRAATTNWADEVQRAIALTNQLRVAGKYMAQLHAQILPGRHVFMMNHIYGWPSREFARKNVQWGEDNALASWQGDVRRGCEDIAREVRLRLEFACNRGRRVEREEGKPPALLAIWTAAGTCIEADLEQSRKEEVLQKVAEQLIRMNVKNRAMLWVMNRLVVEYGDESLLPWEILYHVERQLSARRGADGRPELPEKNMGSLTDIRGLVRTEDVLAGLREAFKTKLFLRTLNNQPPEIREKWQRRCQQELKDETKKTTPPDIQVSVD